MTTQTAIMTTKEQIAAIRKAIKAKIPTVSVRNNSGTAWGWIGIHGSDEHGMFTEAERTGLKALGFTPGGNYTNISPDSRGYWLKKLTGMGNNPPCLVCHAESTESFNCPCDLVHWTCPEHVQIHDCAWLGR